MKILHRRNEPRVSEIQVFFGSSLLEGFWYPLPAKYTQKQNDAHLTTTMQNGYYLSTLKEVFTFLRSYTPWVVLSCHVSRLH